MSSAAPQVRVQVKVNREPISHPNAVPIGDPTVGDDAPRGKTGPQTPEAKARISSNALRHGLASDRAVITGETAQGFADYRASLLRDTQPVGAREEDCVERMLMSQWKLRRLWRQERFVYFRWEHRFNRPDIDGALGYLKDCTQEQALTRLSRYEPTLHRVYHQSEYRLRVLQDLRRQGQRNVAEEDAAQQAAAAPQAITPEAVTTVPALAQIEVAAQPEAPEEPARVGADRDPPSNDLRPQLTPKSTSPVIPTPDEPSTYCSDAPIREFTKQLDRVDPARMAAD